MIILRNYQEEPKRLIFQAWMYGYRNVLLVMPTGAGKCLGEDTPVLMYDGSIKLVQEIRQDDLIMGPDSKPRQVIGTCTGESDLYKITPVKGDSWICNDVHMLTLKHTKSKKIIDIELPAYLKESKNFKHLHKQFRIGVNFKSQSTWIDPYLLGIYLAEGTYCNNSLTTPEPEIKDYLLKWNIRNDMQSNVIQGKGCETLWFADLNQGWNKNKVKKLRKSCTSKTDRWIPKEFLINDKETRLEVLAGLLDGDGHLSNNGFEIITKYPTLSENILFLTRSLGLAAYVKKCVKEIKSTGFIGEYYRITISGETDKIPNKVKRKKASPRRQIKDVQNTGFKVENIGKGKYYGFELTGDGRFLLGDFTVTHNTKTFVSLVIDSQNDPRGAIPTAILVHRKELVQQISLTLAEEGIYHNLIASRKDIAGIIKAQRRLYGRQYYNQHSNVTVISVDTLISRQETYRNWVLGIMQVITDEAAHVLRENKWGKAIAMFANARTLGVTATPQRLDRKGLGSETDGVYDVMIQGPTTRWLIENGFLSKYKIAIPISDFNKHLVSASDTSDYSKQAMIEASTKSHIIGDVVQNYVKFAKGKQTILFATDVGTAKKMEKQFNDAGFVAKALDATSADSDRLESLIKFQEKKIQILINVDLFDEGLDVPGIECVIMARPTKSLGKFLQMVGRGLRLAKDKPFMILIDHVGNVQEHGLPCDIRSWTLDRISKRGKQHNFLRICSNIDCNAPYDRSMTECPWCGFEAISQGSGGGGGKVLPTQVDGDLFLVDPETLRELENKTHLEDPGTLSARVAAVAGAAAGLRAMKNQQERMQTQRQLAEAIANWAGYMKKYQGFTDRQIHKKFFLLHNKTITEALAEPKEQMLYTMESL